MNTLFSSDSLDPQITPPSLPDTTTGVPLSAELETFLKWREKHDLKRFAGEASTIRVSEVLGSIAHLYEKIRNIIEYKGEFVLRRNAIERIQRRLLWERMSADTSRIAQLLIRELIWARYLPNDAVPKRKVAEVAAIINKYLYFLGKMAARGHAISDSSLKSWIWGVASCEIEEALDPSNREPFVTLMYSWFTTHFTWENDNLSDHEKETQIYLAVHRGLTKSDDQIMRYHLLLKEFPTWVRADATVVDQLVERFNQLYQEIEKHLVFVDRLGLYRLVQRQVAPFEVLRQLVEQEGGKVREVLVSPETLEQKVREICQIRYSQIQKKVNRGILRSILYIFATKVLLALLIEIPYELYVLGTLTFLPLGINVVVPPTLMFLIGLTIKAPGEENTQRILNKLKSIVYENATPAPTVFSLAKARRGSFMANVFAVVYLILFLVVFGLITYGLYLLHFSIVGMAIFFIFISLVMLFGYRVRFTAQELKVTSDRESVFGYLFNNITLPFLSTGVYLSKGLARINFLTVILDFLIEAPLKTIIEVVEEWTSFIREKREEVVEVPQQ
jgi:hypothetical protein